jgi:hypothetical protein
LYITKSTCNHMLVKGIRFYYNFFLIKGIRFYYSLVHQGCMHFRGMFCPDLGLIRISSW